MATKTIWSDTDALLCINEALADQGLTPERKQELIRSLLDVSMCSARAFKILWRYRGNAALTGGLPERARSASFQHPNGIYFRRWLESVWEDEPEPNLPPLLTRSQRRAREALQATAAVYFSGAFSTALIRPRTNRLIAGPSGVGKTHLMTAVAEENGWGFLKLVFGEWIPLGGRGEPTKEVVARFLDNQTRCVIFIDELDKFGVAFSGGEWSTAIMNEIYCLLDRSWFQGLDPHDRDIRLKLRESTFIVGAGTFQHLWAVEGGAQRTIGFHECAHPPMDHAIKAAKIVAPELLNRFMSEIIFLEPLTREDFTEMCSAAEIDRQAAAVGISLDYGQAAASGLGVRWIEAKVLQIEIERMRRRAAFVGPVATNQPVLNNG